jgi:hypothetical protein
MNESYPKQGACASTSVATPFGVCLINQVTPVDPPKINQRTISASTFRGIKTLVHFLSEVKTT